MSLLVNGSFFVFISGVYNHTTPAGVVPLYLYHFLRTYDLSYVSPHIYLVFEQALIKVLK
ncbi:MAG: hypothetical protein AB9834_21230 [Lentimicrobium sp.]